MHMAEVGGNSARSKRRDSVTGTQAIDRAMSVLQCFSREQRKLGITEIARALDLSPSTVHRIVRALTERGFLRQNPLSDRYELGQSVVILGQAAQRNFGLDHALPLLKELAQATGESVNLGVRNGDRVVVLLHVESPQALRFHHKPGAEVPLHASAMGKCLIAWSRDPLGLLKQYQPLPGLTPTTITELDEWEAEVKRIRQRRYSIDNEESVVGVRCVGAPILDGDGTADLALAVLAPSVRMADRTLKGVSRQVLDTARRIQEIRDQNLQEVQLST